MEGQISSCTCPRKRWNDQCEESESPMIPNLLTLIYSAIRSGFIWITWQIRLTMFTLCSDVGTLLCCQGLRTSVGLDDGIKERFCPSSLGFGGTSCRTASASVEGTKRDSRRRHDPIMIYSFGSLLLWRLPESWAESCLMWNCNPQFDSCSIRYPQAHEQMS